MSKQKHCWETVPRRVTSPMGRKSAAKTTEEQAVYRVEGGRPWPRDPDSSRLASACPKGDLVCGSNEWNLKLEILEVSRCGTGL